MRRRLLLDVEVLAPREQQGRTDEHERGRQAGEAEGLGDGQGAASGGAAPGRAPAAPLCTRPSTNWRMTSSISGRATAPVARPPYDGL